MLYLYLKLPAKTLSLLLKALEKDFTLERISQGEIFIKLKNDRFLKTEIDKISNEIFKVVGSDRIEAYLAPSRFLAKAISFYPEKSSLIIKIPFGGYTEVAFLAWEFFDEYLDRLPIESLWPCPQKLIETLNSLGFKYLGLLKTKSREELTQLFQFWGEVLFYLVRGQDFLQFNYYQSSKDLTLSSQFPEGITNSDFLRFIEEVLSPNITKVFDEDLGAMGFSWSLETVEGKVFKGERLFNRPIADQRKLLTNLNLSLIKEDALREDIFHFALVIKDLTPVLLQQKTIFLPEESSKGDLEKIIRYLAKRYPHQQVYLGKNLVVNRREARLAWWDPWRFRREANENRPKSTSSGF